MKKYFKLVWNLVFVLPFDYVAAPIRYWLHVNEVTSWKEQYPLNERVPTEFKYFLPLGWKVYIPVEFRVKKTDLEYFQNFWNSLKEYDSQQYQKLLAKLTGQGK